MHRCLTLYRVNRKAQLTSTNPFFRKRFDGFLLASMFLNELRTMGNRRQYGWSNREDSILYKQYGRDRNSTSRAIQDVCSMHPDWPRKAVVERARQLGLSKSSPTNTAPWSSDAIDLLRELENRPVQMIAEQLHRSTNSIRAKLRRLGLSSDFFGGYKTKDVMRHLRVPEIAVERWLSKGWLVRENGRITQASVDKLCLEHPEEVPNGLRRRS
jgi:hypothetical protein